MCPSFMRAEIIQFLMIGPVLYLLIFNQNLCILDIEGLWSNSFNKSKHPFYIFNICFDIKIANTTQHRDRQEVFGQMLLTSRNITLTKLSFYAYLKIIKVLSFHIYSFFKAFWKNRFCPSLVRSRIFHILAVRKINL